RLDRDQTNYRSFSYGVHIRLSHLRLFHSWSSDCQRVPTAVRDPDADLRRVCLHRQLPCRRPAPDHPTASVWHSICCLHDGMNGKVAPGMMGNEVSSSATQAHGVVNAHGFVKTNRFLKTDSFLTTDSVVKAD